MQSVFGTDYLSLCRGTNHYYQSDVLFTFPSRADKSFTSTLDVVTAHRVNMDISHAFLKRHLLMGECYYNPVHC